MCLNINEYLSLMDALFCAVFPWEKRACQRFYDGVGEPLRNLYDARTLAELDERLKARVIRKRTEDKVLSWGLRDETECARLIEQIDKYGDLSCTTGFGYLYPPSTGY